MQVNDLTRINQMRNYQQTQRTKAPQEPHAGEPILDGISISAEALQMAQHSRGAEGNSPSGRVAELKQAIQCGTYQPSLHDVAAAILKQHGPF